MKKFGVVFIVVIALLTSFFVLLFSGSSYTVPEHGSSQWNMTGGTVELDSDGLNGLVGRFFTGSKTSGNITVKGINGVIEDGIVKFYIPISYRSFNFLMTTQGKVYFKNGNIDYEPSFFKLGKIRIPKAYVLKKLDGKLKGNLNAEGDVLSISSSLLPVRITSIKIENDKMMISFGQYSIRGLGNINGQFADSIIHQLDAARNDTSGSAGKAAISKIISAVQEAGNNPSTNMQDLQKNVKNIYNELSESDKQQVKKALDSNMNGGTMEILKNIIH